jgi:hypothetical protein
MRNLDRLTGLLTLLIVATARSPGAAPERDEKNSGSTLTYVFSRISVPGATSTDAWSINGYGDVVGFYVDAGGTHGFFLDGDSYTAAGANTEPIPPIQGGTFITIDVPGATLTEATANNDRGDIAGVYRVDGDTTLHAFLLRAGAFIKIDVPGATASTPRGLGDRSEVVFEAVVNGKNTAYILSKGAYTNIEPPASFAGGAVTYSYASGINRAGTIVGRYDDMFHGAGRNRGFALLDGAYGDIFFPGAVSAAALGINDRNTIVGGYTLNGLRRGFALQNTSYTSIDIPGCAGTAQQGAIACTTPRKINNHGRIVGFFGLGGTDIAGFIARPVQQREQ